MDFLIVLALIIYLLLGGAYVGYHYGCYKGRLQMCIELNRLMSNDKRKFEAIPTRDGVSVQQSWED